MLDSPDVSVDGDWPPEAQFVNWFYVELAEYDFFPRIFFFHTRVSSYIYLFNDPKDDVWDH